MDPFENFSPGFSAPGSPGSFTNGPYSPMDSPIASPQRGRSRPSTNDKEAYGLNLGMLRKWHREKKDEMLSSEQAKQEIAVSKVRGFLDAVGCVVRIQSWWRMMKPYHAFLDLKKAQKQTKAVYYRALRLYWKSERLYRVQIFGKFFIGWREEARTAKKLKSLIREFFKICIQRLRLTPQACMAFFNPGEWSRSIAKEDMLKIRRLMLEKLFSGWRSETVFLRMVRYKASQILSRMVRRTKGPLWVKESTLVCFHMWFRYIQVKKAYRHDLPDPRYTNPMLPQWTKLMKDITVNRIKRKRTRELGMQLTQLRSFNRWKRLMSVDRTKPVTPLAVAIMHYSTVLMTKVLHLWHNVIRERGKLMRFRTKIFQTWRKWAPKHKQMRIFNDKAQELIRLKLVQRAYGVMIKLCFNVIGTRTERIKELRRNFCDRRVVICAYALLHKDSHVMMVDCWRRLYFYWKSRRNWKSVTWHYTYEWHAHKMKVIFLAWKSLTQPTHGLPSGLFGRPHVTSNTPHKPSVHPNTYHNLNIAHSISAAVSVASSTNTSVRSHGAYISETESESETATPRGTLSRADSTHSVDSVSTMNSEEPSALMFGANRRHVPSLGVVGGVGSMSLDGNQSQPGSAANSARDENGNSPHKFSQRRSSFRGKVTFTSPYHPKGLLASKEVHYEKLVRDFVPRGLSIVQRGLEGKLTTKLNGLQFRVFCIALSRSYAQLANRLHPNNSGMGGVGSVSHVEGVSAANSVAGGGSINGAAAPATPASSTFITTNSTTLDTPSVYARVAAPALNGMSTTSASTVLVGPSADKGSTTDASLSSELHFPVHLYFNRALQERLQTAIDEVNMECVLQAVSEGAVIESAHIRQIGLHIGDLYMPLFTLLLTNSVQFFADRVVKQDAQQVLMDIQNPINAYLTGSQIERWNRHEVTYRESMHITENLPTQRYLSGEFASYYLMRFIILKNIDLKAKRLLHLCVMLPETRTVDQEVPEVLKRQKLAKLYRLRKSLTEMIGGDDSFQETYLAAISSIPPLVRPANRPVTPPYAHTGDTAGKDIYTVLREFTLLTGKLTTEARSLRQPLMERDDRLIANGFLRGARADYLALREQCLTPAQRAEIAEKAQKAADKERKIAEKAKLKERKRRDKLSGVSSKKHKKGKKGSGGVTDLNFDALDNEACSSGDEGYASENYGSSSSELNKLNFLYGGMNIGEQHDLQHEVDFIARTSRYKYQVYAEVWQRPNWREQASVRSNITHNMVIAMRSTIKRIMDLFQADKTIGAVDYVNVKSKFNNIGAYLVNHVLANIACRRSSTWYVLPRDYWSFRVVRERVNVEVALADATVHSIRTQLNTDHHDNYHINNDISKYQKFLKQTRKEILVIAEKRANKSSADTDERAPFVGNIKKCDTKIRSAEKAIEVIRDKLRRAEFQVAAGNATGAGEIFIPPVVVVEETKKNKKAAPEAAVVTYDFKTVYALIDAANTEIESLKSIVAEQSARKKEGENSVRMYDWQCQRTSRMLRDLAETRFQTMIDVQLVAVREAKRLDSTQDHQDAQSVRYKQMKRYARHLTDFLEGPIHDRAAQLAREAEQRRVSEIMNRSPASRPTDYNSQQAALSSAREVSNKKRGLLAPFSEENTGSMSPIPSFRSAISNVSDVDLDRPMTAAMSTNDLFSGGNLDEVSVDESNYSYEDDVITLMLAERSKHENTNNEENQASDAVDTADGVQDTRTSSQIAVDRELELAHFNSAENRIKREAELKLLAEEQARELATQDLRIRVFEEYWTALPQNMERVQRKKNKEVEEVAQSEESSVVVEEEATNEHLTRTQRTWKSIGTQYWRSKTQLVTDLVQQGQDVTDVHLKFRAIDPLDEDLNELPPVPVMSGYKDDAVVPSIEHARDVNRLHSTNIELWLSTAQSEHKEMLSVSMKEINEHEGPDPDIHTATAASGASVGRQSSDGSIGRAPSTGVSRQPSIISRQHSNMSEHTTHTTATANRAVKPIKPDPFALAARDEHIRFVDRTVHAYTEGDVIKPIGSFDTQHESELLHAELGVLVTKHHHMPTLVEGERFAAELEAGLHKLNTTAEEEEEEEEKYEDFRTASASFLKFNESLGLSHSISSGVLVPPSPDLGGSLRESATFEKFDKIFDKLSTSIVGALEEAFPTTDDGSSAVSEPSVLSNSSKLRSGDGSRDGTTKERRKRRGTLVSNPTDSSAISLESLTSALGGFINDPHNITTSLSLSVDDTPVAVAMQHPLVHSHSTTSSASESSKGSRASKASKHSKKHDTQSTAATHHSTTTEPSVSTNAGKGKTLKDKVVSFIDKTKTTVAGASSVKKSQSSKVTRATISAGSPKGAHATTSVNVDSESDTSVSEQTRNASPKARKGSVSVKKSAPSTPNTAASRRQSSVTPTRKLRNSITSPNRSPSPLGNGGVSGASSVENTPRAGTASTTTTGSRANTPIRRASSLSKPITPSAGLRRRTSSPAHSMIKQASGRGTPTQRSRSNTLNSSATNNTGASRKNSLIEEGSETSTHTPPLLELTASRAASRAKMEFSDELLPSGRDPYEDDVTSEISMEVYNSELGVVAMPRVPGLFDSTKSAYSPQQSPPLSGRSSPTPAPLERSNTFKVSVDKLMETMSLEPQMPAHYLPEKEIRTAIFGDQLDTGAAGLVAFLQSFASNETDSSSVVKKVKKPAPIEVDKGLIAVPMGGEWVLKPSLLAPQATYSPKILPFSPKASDGPRGGQYASPTQVLSVPKEAPKSFVLEGTALGSPAKPDVTVLAVPALSPTDSRRLAHKLGFDTTPVHHNLFDPVDAPNPDLLSMVREFSIEKQEQEQKLQRLEEKSVISYFPSNFRQNKDRAKDSGLYEGSGFGEYDDSSDHEDVYTNNNAVSNEHTTRKSISRNADSSGEPSRRTSLRNSTDYNNADIMAAVAAVGGAGSSFVRNANMSTKSDASIMMPSVYSTKHAPHTPHTPHVVPYVTPHTVTTTTTLTTNATSDRKPSTDSGASGPGSAPAARLSVKMQEMLSRRGSYNPAEIRLELLESIHDQIADNHLDLEVNSAVREVKKYLHDREEEAHRSHPTGRLRTKESFASAYREAVQGSANPYKQLSVTRSVQLQQDAAAVQNMHLSRRNTASTAPISPPGSPKNSSLHQAGTAHSTHNAYNPVAEERRDSDLHLDTATHTTHSAHHYPDLYSQHQQALLQQQQAEGADPYIDQYAYMVNRAGTPEFWVDVAKIVPTASNARDDDVSSASGGLSGMGGVEGERRVVFTDAQYSQYEPQYGQQRTQPPVEYTYGQESVLGYTNDTAVNTNITRHNHPPPLSVDAVKLPHPVSSSVDPKTVGQYSLYRDRSPLRSPPRSREGVRTDAHNNANKQKKGMVYSHSDGLLLGANAMIKGTKMSLTTHLPASNSISDDNTTGGESFLSPIQFNLSLKPFSPPAYAVTTAPYFGSLESEGEGGTLSHNNSFNNKWKLDTSSVLVEGRAVEAAERAPRTPSRLSRMNSREVIVSGVGTGVNTNASSPPASPAHAVRGKAPIVLPSTQVIHSPDTVNTAHTQSEIDTRDYRASASAAKIISEIAGENYFVGMGVHTELNTGNNSITGASEKNSASGTSGMVDIVLPPSQFEGSLVHGGDLDNSVLHISNTDVMYTDEGIPEFNLSPNASPTASQMKHASKKVATKTTNLVFSPDSATTQRNNAAQNNANSDNYSINTTSTFSFNLAESESEVHAERLKLPRVVTTTTSTNNTSSKEYANIITSARRVQDNTPLEALVVVPQAMSGLNKINDLIVQKQGSLKTVGPVSKSALQAQLQAKKKVAPFLKALTAVEVARGSTEAVLGSAMSDLDSIPSHHSSMNIPAPVSKVNFTVHDTYSSNTAARDRAVMSQYTAEQQQADEASIEAELRQMLHIAHNEDAAEAYRQQYYRQNKEHLANAGVAIKDEVNPHASDAAGNVPFVAGSKGRGTNTNVSAVTGGLNAIQRIQMSSSVGGGGFNNRGNGVLHKVKGAAGSARGSASTSQLPPLDPAVLLNVESNFSDPSSRTPKVNKSGKNTKFAVTDEILHQRQILSALLNHTTADMYELDRPLDPSTYVTGTASSKTKVGVDTLQASKSNKIFSAPAGNGANTNKKTVSSAGSVNAPGAGQLLLTRHGSRKGSMDSISSMGSVPLQSIHAPAVEISNHTGTTKTTGRKY